jgi:hypothetical protein
MNSATIDKLFLRVAKVQTLSGMTQLTNATGFFCLHDNFLYLITSRHVVINETLGHHPDVLQLTLHTDALDLRKTAVLSIPLYLAGVPQWIQHPKYQSRADVVAVAINDPQVLNNHFIDTFRTTDIVFPEQNVPIGQEVLILGFPLGFHDTVNHLPVVRSATIASSFSHPFQGEPCFLTDARMHRGSSGSPVIAKMPAGSQTVGQAEQKWQLLGIHSSAMDVSDRDHQLDERLALNTAWYASLIPEMLPKRGDSSAAGKPVGPPPLVKAVNEQRIGGRPPRAAT